MNLDSVDKSVFEEFVKLTKDQLSASGANVSEDQLKAAMFTAKDNLSTCDQCVAGWRW